MPPKNGSSAGYAGDQVKLLPVQLAKPARIDGRKYEAGEIVDVDQTVAEQLHRADALDLEETAALNKPAEDPKQA